LRGWHWDTFPEGHRALDSILKDALNEDFAWTKHDKEDGKGKGI